MANIPTRLKRGAMRVKGLIGSYDILERVACPFIVSVECSCYIQSKPGACGRRSLFNEQA